VERASDLEGLYVARTVRVIVRRRTPGEGVALLRILVRVADAKQVASVSARREKEPPGVETRNAHSVQLTEASGVKEFEPKPLPPRTERAKTKLPVLTPRQLDGEPIDVRGQLQAPPRHRPKHVGSLRIVGVIVSRRNVVLTGQPVGGRLRAWVAHPQAQLPPDLRKAGQAFAGFEQRIRSPSLEERQIETPARHARADDWANRLEAPGRTGLNVDPKPGLSPWSQDPNVRVVRLEGHERVRIAGRG
jgi:hypothetical protein